MNKLQENLVSTRRIFDGKIINLRIDTVTLPNGKEAKREIVEHPGAVAVVPLLPDGRIIMVRQYRHAVGKALLEIPAGKLDRGEIPEQCAARELEEETGYACNQLRSLTSVWTTPGFSDEIIHIYAAENLQKKVQNLDEDEFLQIVKIPIRTARMLFEHGFFEDAKTVCALGYYFSR